jgi:hypothetical protein
LASTFKDNKTIENMQRLFKLSGFSKCILKSLDIKMEERNHHIILQLLNILYFYLLNNKDNQDEYLQNHNSLKILYRLLYDNILYQKVLKILDLLSIEDIEQKYIIVPDLINILFNINYLNEKLLVLNDEKDETHEILYLTKNIFESKEEIKSEISIKPLDLIENILISFRKMFNLNRKIKDTFRKFKGYESLNHLLNYLNLINKKNDLNNVLNKNIDKEEVKKSEMKIFQVLQSILLTFTVSMKYNKNNKKYFLNDKSENPDFQNLFGEDEKKEESKIISIDNSFLLEEKTVNLKEIFIILNDLNFMKKKVFNLHLCLNIFQLSLMSANLYSENYIEIMEENLNKKFIKIISNGVFIFENPEIITNFLELISKNISHMDTELSTDIFNIILILIKKFILNKKLLTGTLNS